MKIYNGNRPIRNGGYYGVNNPTGDIRNDFGYYKVPIVKGVQDTNDVGVLRPAGQWPGTHVDINSGLVFRLDAGDPNGIGVNKWLDTSGNGYDATLYNSPTFNESYGGSWIFNGVNQYGNQPYTALQSFGTQWTFISFFRLLRFNGWGTIWSNATQWDPQGRGNPKLHGIAYVGGEAWTSRYSLDSYASKVLWGTGGQGGPSWFQVGDSSYDVTDNGWRSVCIVGSTFGGEQSYGETYQYWWVNNVYKNLYAATGYQCGIDWIGNRINLSGDIWIGGINAQRRSDGGFYLTAYSNIEIAIIMLYNRQLNETERTTIWNTYRWRFGM